MRKPLPPPNNVRPDTPLRLEMAARLAFPDGSIGESGLRKEATRGRLQHERLRGKLHTTLAWIEDWRALCRVQPNQNACGSVPKSATPMARSANAPSGLSETDRARRALAALKKTGSELRKRSPSTSPANTPSRESATVIPLRSSS